MKFEVMNKKQARRYSFSSHEDKSIIVSISNWGEEDNSFHLGENNIKAILFLSFDDIEATNDKNEHPITKEDAKRVEKFVNKYKNKVDKIIVHCEAGVSRSAGVCAAIMKALNGDDWEIFDNPRFCPNMTCYNTVLEAFIDGGYFKDEDPIEEAKLKEEHNIVKWKIFNDIE